MKASDYVAAALASYGVTSVFEMCGGMITHIIDSLYRQGRVRIVSMHHEQAAAFAADATGRLSGIPGVAMATSGPGATNLLTGVGSCYFDSSPAVFITGQVNRNEMKGDRPIRQLGFQETDIVTMARPITKAAWRVDDATELPVQLCEAFALATDGRPGPVLIDIPMDVQREDLRVRTPEPLPSRRPAEPREEQIIELLAALRAARRPLIIAGGGVRASGTRDSLRAFARQLGVPIANSLLAVDAMPSVDPLRVGMLGSYGNRWVNLAIARSDLLLVLGSRLDIRQTGADTRSFKAERLVFHVDCDPGEINNRVTGCRAIVADLRRFFDKALALTPHGPQPSRADWLAEIEDLRLEWPDTRELRDIDGINPNVFMHQLSAVSSPAAAYVVDVGQHQMWAAQSLEIGPEQRFLTSGGMGSMGFALPASVGTSFALPGKPVVVIAGDGGFQANIQELQTVARNRLPVKIIIMNNRCHGMVRQFQESYFEARYQSTLWGYSAPEFFKVAAAYGIRSKRVTGEDEVPDSLEWLWQEDDGPSLLEVMIDPMANAYPKIAFGRPITEMEPFAKPLAIEGA